MIQTTLQFPTIVHLVDFQVAVDAGLMEYDIKTLTVTGKFSEAEIELAQAGFDAVILDRNHNLSNTEPYAQKNKNSHR